MRLRNLDYWNVRGKMSPFGCSFVAMGTLMPASSIGQALDDLIVFLSRHVGLYEQRLQLGVYREHLDLLSLVSASGMRVVAGEAQEDYLYRYGMPDMSGRSIKITASEPNGGVTEVAAVVEVARLGAPIAVETAFSVNILLTSRESLIHPVLASVGALGADEGVDTLIALDCLGTAVSLLAEGLLPTARGRGGRLRQLLRTAVKASPVLDWPSVITRLADAETSVRSNLSPPDRSLFEDLSASDTAARFGAALARVG